MKKLAAFLLPLTLMSCGSTQPRPNDDTVRIAVRLATGIGDAILRQKGLAELRRTAPELIPVIDIDPETPGVLTIAEVRGFVESILANPEQVALLITTLVLIRES